MFFRLVFPLLFAAIDISIKYKIRSWGGFYICNKGISWGIILPEIFFWLILAFFLLLIIYLSTKSTKGDFFSLFLILTGSISNISDRFLYGCVVDYIGSPKINFPYFNISDMLITIGCILFLVSFLTKKRPDCA